MNRSNAIKSFLNHYQMIRLFVNSEAFGFINDYSHLRSITHNKTDIGFVFLARSKNSDNRRTGTITIGSSFFYGEILTLAKMKRENEEDLKNRFLLAECRIKMDSVMKMLDDAEKYAEENPINYGYVNE